MKNKLFFFFVLFTLLPLSDIQAAKILGMGSKNYDIVFTGSPISVREIRAGDSLDAVADPTGENPPKHVVSFKIERVLIGTLPKEKRGGPSRLDQARDALDKKEFLQLASMNFENPDDEFDKELFRIAVENAGETFGLMPGEPLPSHRFKIYLKQLPKNPQTFLFVKRDLLD